MKKILLTILAVGCLLTACGNSYGAASEPEETPVSETVRSGGRISPLPSAIDMSHLDNCTVFVSLKEGDAYVDDTGAMQMKITVYDYDRYDMTDMARLQPGDILTIRKNDITVTDLEREASGTVKINGGLVGDGYELVTDDSGVYYEILTNDAHYWQELGTATIPVSPDFTLSDSSDPEKGEVIRYPGDFLMADGPIDYDFTPNQTSLVIQDGRVISMRRIYIP